VPVTTRPRKPTHFNTEDDADVSHRHFRNHALESDAILDAAAAHPQVIVDHFDTIDAPSHRSRAIDEAMTTVVPALAGVAALALDSQRTAKVAAVLEPYAVFPRRMSFVGVYEFCRSLEQVGLENQPEAAAQFDSLLARFQNPRYYPHLRGAARSMCVAPLWFARGAFATFKADGALALRCADELDALGFKFYAMIASQLRYLYFMFRGQTAAAAPHRASVEVYAAQVGSAWQVETWECPAMILLCTNNLDMAAATRVAHRLDTLSKIAPSLRRYQRLVRNAFFMMGRDAQRHIDQTLPEYLALPPRSFIGWSAALAYYARSLNELGQHERAKSLCEQTLAQLSDAHREYVALFLMLDTQLAVAHAGLKDYESALARIDMMIKRFAGCDHPLLQGSLFETRAQICWAAGDAEGYEYSRGLMEYYFLLTQTPALIARCEQLAQRSRAAASLAAPSVVNVLSKACSVANDSEPDPETAALLHTQREESGAG